jgi:hypothetical protein
MNTLQFMSLVGGAGAPEDNEENKGRILGSDWAKI